MQIVIHQTDHIIGNFTQIYNYIEDLVHSKDFQNKIHIFPEEFLTGYPLQDLVLQKTFIREYHQMLDALSSLFEKIDFCPNTALLFGGIRYEFTGDIPSHIYNVIYEVKDGSILNDVYTKCLLPAYDIFDETKYYTPGNTPTIWQMGEYSFGLLICEDMWHSSQYSFNPLQMLMDEACDKKLNGIINFSASPWSIDKEEKRIKRASEISRVFNNIPFYYVNKVGAEDEIIFDGGSFVVRDTEVIAKCKSFQAEVMNVQVEEAKKQPTNLGKAPAGAHSWESLFGPQIDTDNNQTKLRELTDEKLDAIMGAINLGLHDYARKCGMNKFLVALSGGLDSAVVLTLVKLFLKPGQELEAIYMPSKYSATLSWEISDQLCKNLGVKLHNVPIKFLHSSMQNLFQDGLEPLTGLADENIQSRLRGNILYARSNQTGAMVINTSNKSELAVGYSTIYGDSVGALSILGDLYKSEVFALARHINKNFNNIIPIAVIERPPSAELREEQKDEDSLPPYPVLDMILESYLSYRYDKEDLLKLGLNKTEVERVIKLILNSEYKRQQFCPILKLKDKSFGFGRRVPICKKVDFNIGESNE